MGGHAESGQLESGWEVGAAPALSQAVGTGVEWPGSTIAENAAGQTVQGP